jgi:predicted metal-dependent hydrolase
MKDIIKELETLSKKIEEAKHKKSSCEGRQLEILKQLKNKYDVETIEEAESLLEEYQQKMDVLEKEIKVKFDELKNKLGRN